MTVKCRGQRRQGWHCEWQQFYQQRQTMTNLRMGPKKPHWVQEGKAQSSAPKAEEPHASAWAWWELSKSPAAKGLGAGAEGSWNRSQHFTAEGKLQKDCREGMLNAHVRTLTSTGCWGTKESPALGYHSGQGPQGHHSQGKMKGDTPASSGKETATDHLRPAYSYKMGPLQTVKTNSALADRVRQSNGHKRQHSKCRLDTMTNLVTRRLVKPRRGFPERQWILCPWGFSWLHRTKPCLSPPLRALLWTSGWTRDFQKSLLTITPATPWSHNSCDTLPAPTALFTELHSDMKSVSLWKRNYP